jgi:DNA-binding LacI/PurR family transcriptional regulator
MRATMKTVADELGISPSTVSNAYSRPDQLSAELRAEILQTAKRLGYPGPDPSARSLRRGRAGTVGVLFTAHLSTAFTDPFAVAYLRGLAQIAEERDTALQLIPVALDVATGGSTSGGEGTLRAVRNAVVDAFCVYNLPDWHPALEIIRARGLPMVGGFDLDFPAPRAYYVGIDEAAAAQRVGEHVVRFGHRRIAVIADWVTVPAATGPVRGVSADDPPYFVTRGRLRGFRAAFDAAGLPWSEITLINAARNDRACGAEAAASALDKLDRATAVLATSDVLALGVLDALHERGLTAGRDVSVTGFDDIAEAAPAGLTTIRQPSLERGRIVGELLLDPPVEASLPPRILPAALVVRSSTGPRLERPSAAKQ